MEEQCSSSQFGRRKIGARLDAGSGQMEKIVQVETMSSLPHWQHGLSEQLQYGVGQKVGKSNEACLCGAARRRRQ
jgi:hypothetical protein